MIIVDGTIRTPWYDWNGRKYIEVTNEKSVTFRIKIPFRYGRVMARVEGIRPIQDIQLGETVQVSLDQKVWDGQEHWVLIALKAHESNE